MMTDSTRCGAGWPLTPATAAPRRAQLAMQAAAWRQPAPERASVREAETAASMASMGPLFARIAGAGR